MEKKIKRAREKMFETIGVRLKDDGAAVGISTPKTEPHLVNLNHEFDDDSLLLYYLHPGLTRWVEQKERAALHKSVVIGVLFGA